MTRTLNIIKTVFVGAVTAITMAFALCSAAFASESPYILDDYGLLDSSVQQAMESQAQSMADTYGVGTYLLVVDDIGSSTRRDFAKARWNADDLGVGNSKSGILFMIAVDSRDYVTITHGDGVTNFTDYQIGEMEDQIVSYLKDDQWVGGCQAYLDMCETTLAFAAENGEPIDVNNAPVNWTEKIPIALGIAAVLGIIVLIVTRSMLKGQLKSVAPGGNARAYLQGEVNLTHSSEVHLGTTISKTPIPKHEDNVGGGSSIDSSGFGGSSGGKF